MQIKITRTTVAAKQFVLAGQIYDLPDSEARALILLRKAEAVDQPLSTDAVAPVLDTVEASAVVATEAPKRKRGTRGTK